MEKNRTVVGRGEGQKFGSVCFGLLLILIAFLSLMKCEIHDKLELGIRLTKAK